MQIDRKDAYHFIILMGIVSLFGDIVYEGARSVSGPYLEILGANSLAVGIIAGLGEFLGYGVRIFSGYIADRSGLYWPMTIIGYAMLFSIPLLAIADVWKIAGLFLIMERIGKGIRTPARDSILSYVTKRTGRGRGFGLHEALDQIGAIIGPLFFSAIFFLGYGYKKGFSFLVIPACLCLLFLFIAKARIPKPEEIESSKGKKEKGFSRILWLYFFFIFFSVLGFCNFQLISFHIKYKSIFPDIGIPICYAVAMGIDAVFALIIGNLYDKKGITCLALIPILTIPIPFLAFSNSFFKIILGITFWGAIMGVHETIMKAIVADITSPEKRGVAYGFFNTIYGLSFFIGSGIMGYVYKFSISYLIYFCLITQFISIVFLFFLLNKKATYKHS